MSWNDHLLGIEAITPYLQDPHDRNWAARASALIEQQRRVWPLLAEGLAALAEVETKRVPVAESEVVVQHNPRRIRSTAAAVAYSSLARYRKRLRSKPARAVLERG